MTVNFPNVVREKVTQIQEVQRVLIKVNPKRPAPRNIIIKAAKLKDRVDLKGKKGETANFIQGSPDKPIGRFLNRNTTSQKGMA